MKKITTNIFFMMMLIMLSLIIPTISFAQQQEKPIEEGSEPTGVTRRITILNCGDTDVLNEVLKKEGYSISITFKSSASSGSVWLNEKEKSIIILSVMVDSPEVSCITSGGKDLMFYMNKDKINKGNIQYRDAVVKQKAIILDTMF